MGLIDSMKKQAVKLKALEESITILGYYRRGFIAPMIRSEKKIGRNHQCSCGSGKKYKKCCEPK